MRLCEGREDERAAGSAASSCSRNSERVSVPRLSLQHGPADDDEQIGRAELPAAVYLLIKQNQSLIDFSFSLEASVSKLVCVRTSSKGYPPSF